jgi:molybdenum cofactor cytidylyltransferase
MGTPKQTLIWYGAPLLVRQVQAALDCKASEVVVILGENFEEYRSLLKTQLGSSFNNISIIENIDWGLGKTSSVKLGIKSVSARSKNIILWAADSPRTSQLMNDLMEYHISNDNLITYPWYDSIEGHPGIFSLSLKEELFSITEEKQGLREIVNKNPGRVSKFISDDALSIVNMNTLEDYNQALSLTKQI